MPIFEIRYKKSGLYSSVMVGDANKYLISASKLVPRMIQASKLGYDAKRKKLAQLIENARFETGDDDLVDHWHSPTESESDDEAIARCLAGEHISWGRRLSLFEMLCHHIFKEPPAFVVELLNRKAKEFCLPIILKDVLFYLIDDRTVEGELDPFWALLTKGKLDNVEADFRESIRQRDLGGSDPAFHAFRALESVVKIASKKMGVNTGGEKSAINFIDNIASKRCSNPISAWEADCLKMYFSKIRNPTNHGAGSEPQPKLDALQIQLAIEICLVWAKRIINKYNLS